ncbi:hypothetical protein [Nostoc sp.]
MNTLCDSPNYPPKAIANLWLDISPVPNPQSPIPNPQSPIPSPQSPVPSP